MVRLVTYNVHRCVGTDRRLDVGRVAEVIAAQSPDIVALQELDVGRARTGGVDQAHRLALRLGMAFHFNAAFKVEEEQFGDAILTTLPERLVKAGPIPGHPRFAQLEPRGAIWVEIVTKEGLLNVINTHLGLVPREQRIQAAALTGKDWLADAAQGAPLVLLGDMNATPRNAAYRIFAARLAESRRVAPFSHRAPTFPSTFPVLAIDHVFVNACVVVDAVRTPLDPLSRLASDHLPLVVDLSLASPPSPRKPA
jgi:endonuclease/exonuclease/phosphatase family metal-dependent hydrolase